MRSSDNPQEHGSASSWRMMLALSGFALIGAFFLLSEHRAHLLGILPWLLLLACPLMHLLMHGGHGHGKGEAPAGDRAAPHDYRD